MYEKRKKYGERKRNVRRAQAQCTESAAQCTEGAYLYAGRTKKRTEGARDHVPNPKHMLLGPKLKKQKSTSTYM